jgi:adenylate cyclase
MTDVFVSYARSTEPQAMAIAAALRAKGYGVWRDDQIPAHRAYADVIAERLKSSKAVVVIWSADAAKSQWVRSEADAARAAGKLIQVTVDGTLPPMPFDQVECAELRGWNGEADTFGWRKVTESVATLVGSIEPEPGEGHSRRRGNSICVLPFANMSGEAEQEYFSDGISEDITTDLSKVSALCVTARNTAFMFKSQAVDVCEIARKLGVSHVLEGSVRKSGGRVRINAQLIDGSTGDHVWADRFDRELTDIFAIQDEISHSIVDALKLKLLPEEKKAIAERGTSNVEAYNLYLLARQYWVSGNYGDPKRDERVMRICGRSIELDADYGRAWALLALAQADYSLDFNNPGQEDGLAAAERALEIDPTIAEAHCVKARHLSAQGRHDEADEEVAVALRLEPESWDVNNQAARQAFVQRRMEDATRFFEKAVSLMDSDFRSWGLLIACYRERHDEAAVLNASRKLVEKSEKALTDDPGNGSAMGMMAAGLAILGEKERARELINRALLLDPGNTRSRYNFACALANELSEPQAALDILEPIYDQLGPQLLEHMEADPDFDRIRDDPRFAAGLAKAKAKLASDPIPAAT